MVCRIIWADGVAPRGTKSAIYCKELAIVTAKKTCKEITNKRKLKKSNPIERCSIINSKIDKQWN